MRDALIPPDMDAMIALMQQAKDIAPNLTTTPPVPLTAVQVAWIVGKIKSSPPALGDDEEHYAKMGINVLRSQGYKVYADIFDSIITRISGKGAM